MAPPCEYLQIVENHRVNGKIRQKVLWTIGRADRLKAKGAVDQLIKSLSQYSDKALLLLAGASDPDAVVSKIGPPIIFERLWERTGIKK